ncbi:MAG: PAAR domain-containing protein [Burkholderiales bacterium]|nr:PAAR domain-containing protein [Burkholderiales bacterium]
MPGIAAVGVSLAGGLITGGGQGFVRVDGAPWAVLGDAVQGHGALFHANPHMVEGSSFVRINGVPACIAGNAASCGHLANGLAWANVAA